MSEKRKVAVIVGSLRKGSYNRLIARAAAEVAPANLELEIVEIRDLPLYDQDLDDEGRAPQEWTRFRDQVRPVDAVLFVTPEYNRSVPAPLKNAIDVGSRPYGKSVWSAKPAAIISASPGAIGGFGANQHLRQSLVFLDMPPMQMPEAYIGGVGKMFDDAGKLTNDSTREFLGKFMATFAGWIEKTRKTGV